VFNFSKDELSVRTVKRINIATDDHMKYSEKEDPTILKLTKSKLGPLKEDWMEEGTKILVYKYCKVSIDYWGIQGKVYLNIIKG
jgi:hypothetical protein